MVRERLVIDSGYLLESVLPTNSEWQQDADDLMDALINRDVAGVVPWLFFAELAAVCSRKVRSKTLHPDEAQAFLNSVEQLGLDVDIQLEWPRQLYDDAMKINVQVYDTMYIMLSQRMGGLPIATRDNGMLAGVRGAKLPLYHA